MLEKNIKYIKGVGPKRAEVFNKIGINKLKDLIEYYPREYEDRTVIKKIIELTTGSKNAVKAKIISPISSITTFSRASKRRMSIQKTIIEDDSGRAHVTWFNQPYLVNQLKLDETYYFYGISKVSSANFEINSPEVEAVKEKGTRSGSIIPVYGLTYGLKQNVLRNTVSNAFSLINQQEGFFKDFYSKEFLEENSLISLQKAITNIHFPEDKVLLELAKKRLIFDELFFLSLMLFSFKIQNKKEEGPKLNKDISLSNIIDELPFKLTNAQIKVMNEIEDDLESDLSMDRLLQGDVGSGKTIIAILAAYKAAKDGYQSAILAPTQILVMQHYNNFKEHLEKYGIKIGLLISSLKKKEKEEVLEQIQNGDIDIVIGTHALLEEGVVFKNLGFVVTDEQHRFGVKQRETILAKGKNPNTLVMSATPIPRTLALILYGDLDISIIDELPPNRKEVQTIALNYKATEKIHKFIESEVNKGRQAYVVCPLIEESEELDLNSVEEIYKKYKKRFNKYNVAFMHGKMKDSEKDEIMFAFKDGKIDILVSTTVIEVGVDVPNANIMIVENSERFGLAQLHQLRGRVGRGEYQSYCILKLDKTSARSAERLKIMESTTDGFIIAEKDLELRGSGDFFGTKQHGLPDFKIANLFTDMEILKEAQKIAIEMIEKDPEFKLKENLEIGKKVEKLKSNVVL